MVLIPLKDDNPLKRISFQYVTVFLIAACLLAFLWQLSLGEQMGRLVYGLGTIPAVLTGERSLPPELVVVPPGLTLFTSMFLHGGWLHLIGNMLFLWVFGDNVEDAMGHLRFLFFYVICGVAADLAHVAASLDSTVPTIGASGAVSGVLGAYLVLHPKVRVLTLFFRFIMRLPAFVVLGSWIGLQLLNAWMEAGGAAGGGIAWWAHIGGFFIGAVLVVPFRHKGVPLFAGWTRATAAIREARRRKSSIPDSGRRRQ